MLKNTKKTRFSKRVGIAALACLAAVSPLAMFSCGNENSNNDGEVVGGDWHVMRAWDGVTVEDNGESIELLYYIDQTGLLAYVDNHSEESPDSYAAIAFPTELEDAPASKDGLVFVDIDGDNHTDILVPYTLDGADYIYVYRWDGEGDFTLDEDASYIEGLKYEDGELHDGEFTITFIEAAAE